MEKKYTTVLFDADNTLLDFSKSERMSLIQTMNDYGVSVTEENISIYVEINNGLWKQIEKKEITKPELKRIRFRRFFETIGFETEADAFEVNEHYLALLSNCGYTLDGATELCRKLCENGYNLYIVTNGIAKAQAQRLSKSGLMPYIKDVFVSESVGYPKPMVEFFDYIFENLPEKDKSRIVVVGDSLSSDIKGAMNAGLDSIWLNSNSTPLPDGFTPDFTIGSLDELYSIFDVNK